MTADNVPIPIQEPKTCCRVLHIAPLPPAFGGMITYFQGLLKSEVSQAFKTYVIRNDFLGKYRYKGAGRSVINIVNGGILAFAVLWTLVTYRPAIVHIQTSSYAGFFEKSFLALLARLFSRKVLMHVHGGGFRDFYQHSSHFVRWLIRKSITLNHYIVVASPQMRETFLMIGVLPEKIKLLRNAVNIPSESVWHQCGKEQIGAEPCSQVTILFLNRIVLDKGLLELVDAAKCICRAFPNAHFRIVGPESPDCEIVRRRIAESGVTEQVEFVGPVSDREKKDEFLAADIYVLPSHAEDLPYGLMEAMSFGLPCVASAVGGIPSLIENGKSGLLGPPKDVDALTKALRRLISDASLRRQLGIEARRRVEAEFSWGHRAEEIINFYNSLLAGSPNEG